MKATTENQNNILHENKKTYQYIGEIPGDEIYGNNRVLQSRLYLIESSDGTLYEAHNIDIKNVISDNETINNFNILRKVVNFAYPNVSLAQLSHEIGENVTKEQAIAAMQAFAWTLSMPYTFQPEHNHSNIVKLLNYYMKIAGSGWTSDDLDQYEKSLQPNFVLCDMKQVIYKKNYYMYGPIKVLAPHANLKGATFKIYGDENAKIVNQNGKRLTHVKECQDFYVLVLKHKKICEFSINVCSDIFRYGVDLVPIVGACKDDENKTLCFEKPLYKSLCGCIYIPLTEIEVINQEECNPRNLLAGAAFAIYSDNKLLSKQITNQNGRAIFSNLLTDVYRIEEKVPPAGYKKSQPQHVTTECGKTYAFFENQRIYVKIKVNNFNQITQEKLSGEVFKVVNRNHEVVDIIAVKNGVGYSKYLYEDEYALIEIKAPEGFELLQVPVYVNAQKPKIHKDYIVEIYIAGFQKKCSNPSCACDLKNNSEVNTVNYQPYTTANKKTSKKLLFEDQQKYFVNNYQSF